MLAQVARHASSSVIGRTQALPRHAGSVIRFTPTLRRYAL
jgi:hypothetical protein